MVAPKGRVLFLFPQANDYIGERLAAMMEGKAEKPKAPVVALKQ